jgi:hypothetical protein
MSTGKVGKPFIEARWMCASNQSPYNQPTGPYTGLGVKFTVAIYLTRGKLYGALSQATLRLVLDRMCSN